ncbi:MAG TPA: hypothetical protein VNI01_05905 [Elusimicrobiota bacterium]|nr:hypothetical protein [Elusimicrobiota bacterium]
MTVGSWIFAALAAWGGLLPARAAQVVGGAARDGAAGPGPLLSGTPAPSVLPSPGTDLLLAIVLPDPGDRLAGRDAEKTVQALAESRPSEVRLLSADGPRSLFGARSFALEVALPARDEVLRDLRAIDRLDAHPLSHLLDAASAGPAADLPGPEALSALSSRMSAGPMPERLRAFSELAAALETMGPERIARLPEESRNAALSALYDLSAVSVEALNFVRGDMRQALREREHAAHGDDVPWDWVAVEKASHRALQEPAARARIEPLRGLLAKTIEAMDRLDTPAAREQVLHLLPHAEYAGFELIASRPELKRKYVRAWLGIVANSVTETIAGLRAGPNRSEDWTGSQRSRGYEHLDDRRNSMHLYEWKPGRFNPGELPHELLLLLGLPDAGFPLARMVVAALDAVQHRIPEIDALNRESRIGHDLAQQEAYLAHSAEESAKAGRPIPPETLESFRRQAREQIERTYEESSKVEGHTTVDALLQALHYDPYLAFVPGFDEAAYVASVLGLFSDALAELREPGLLKQLIDSAVSFLLRISSSPFLDEPRLRAQAVSLWRRVASVAARDRFALRTRLDGVIDPRPQLRPSEPVSLSGDVDARSGWAVWQVAESPDGRYIARAAADRTVLVWEAATGRLVKTIRLEDARQYYGDAANSLGAAWTPEGKLLVSTLHEGGFNKVRTFDVAAPQETLGPGDASSDVTVPEVYVLRHMPVGPAGQFLAATVDRHVKNAYGYSDYAGSDIRIFGMDAGALAQIANSSLLDASAGLLLAGPPRGSAPQLALWDVSQPSSPRDATPDWLRAWTAAWRERNRPTGRHGWWPRLEARLGVFAGRPALLVQDEDSLEVLDLDTGRRLRSLEIPNRWTAALYATDASGRYAAAVTAAPGNFQGPGPERLMVWNLATGEIVMERESDDLSALSFTRDGRRLIAAAKGRVQVFELPQ